MAAQTEAQARPGVPPNRLILLVALAALAVRAAVLNGRSLWFDEAFSVAVARLPLPQAWSLIARTDTHPPLYYLLLHFWVRLGDSPSMVRLLSLVFGVLGVVTTWRLARLLGGPVLALASAALLAGATLAIQASVEARMASLLTLLSVAATAALWQALAQPTRRWRWVAYAALVALTLYADYLSVLLVAAHLVYVALAQRRTPGVWPGMLLSLAGVALAFAPWWSAVAHQFGEGQIAQVWRGAMPPAAPLTMVALSGFGGYLLGLGGYLLDDGRWSWPQLLLILPFLVLVAVGAAGLRKDGAGALLLLVWVVPVAGLLGVSLATGLFYAFPRYISFVQPFFLILLGQGLITLTRRTRRVVSVVVMAGGVIVLNLTVLSMTLADARYQPYDWAAAAGYVQARWQQGDALLFYPHTARVAFGYYFTKEDAPAVSLYPPPWGAGLSRAQLARRLPPATALTQNAPRLWLVATEPTPPQSAEALLEVLEAAYLRRETMDFRHVYVLFYERR